MLREFKTFLLRGSVLELAIGRGQPDDGQAGRAGGSDHEGVRLLCLADSPQGQALPAVHLRSDEGIDPS